MNRRNWLLTLIHLLPFLRLFSFKKEIPKDAWVGDTFYYRDKLRTGDWSFVQSGAKFTDSDDAQVADNGDRLKFKHPKVPTGYVINKTFIVIDNNTKVAAVTRELELARLGSKRTVITQTYSVKDGKVINLKQKTTYPKQAWMK